MINFQNKHQYLPLFKRDVVVSVQNIYFFFGPCANFDCLFDVSRLSMHDEELSNPQKMNLKFSTLTMGIKK